jgi:hypothetical protein
MFLIVSVLTGCTVAVRTPISTAVTGSHSGEPKADFANGRWFSRGQ